MNFLMVIVFDWSCMEQDWKFAINNRRFPPIICPRLSSSQQFDHRIHWPCIIDINLLSITICFAIIVRRIIHFCNYP